MAFCGSRNCIGKSPFMIADEQKRVIQHLVKRLTILQREEIVLQRFVANLKAEGRVGTLEELEEIRQSPDVRSKCLAYFHNLDAVNVKANGEYSDHFLRDIIQLLGPQTGESNQRNRPGTREKGPVLVPSPGLLGADSGSSLPALETWDARSTRSKPQNCGATRFTPQPGTPTGPTLAWWGGQQEANSPVIPIVNKT
jgi:hypothetical protein